MLKKIKDIKENGKLFKALAIAAIAVVAAGILILLFAGHGIWNGYFMNGVNGYGLSAVLAVMLKVLLAVSVAGLVLGLGMFFYKKSDQYR